MGESINDYLAIESGGAENAARALTDCAALLNDPKQRREQKYKAAACQQVAQTIRDQAGKLSAAEMSEVVGKSSFSEVQFAAQKLVMLNLALSG